MLDLMNPVIGMIAAAFVVGATYGGLSLILGIFAGPAYTLAGRPTQRSWVKSFLCVCGICVLINGYASLQFLYYNMWEHSYRLSLLETSIGLAVFVFAPLALLTGLLWAQSGYCFGNVSSENRQIEYVYVAPVQEHSRRAAHQQEPEQFESLVEDDAFLPEAIQRRLRGQNGLNN